MAFPLFLPNLQLTRASLFALQQRLIEFNFSVRLVHVREGEVWPAPQRSVSWGLCLDENVDIVIETASYGRIALRATNRDRWHSESYEETGLTVESLAQHVVDVRRTIIEYNRTHL